MVAGIRNWLELFFGNAPSKQSFPETHVQSIRQGFAFPEDAIATDHGADSIRRYRQPAWNLGPRPETNLLPIQHNHQQAILRPLSHVNQGGIAGFLVTARDTSDRGFATIGRAVSPARVELLVPKSKTQDFFAFP